MAFRDCVLSLRLRKVGRLCEWSGGTGLGPLGLRPVAFAEPARVRVQVPDSHLAFVIQSFGDIPAHFVVDRQPTSLRRQQNAHRRELLRLAGRLY